MILFSNTKDNHFRVQNKRVSVSFSLNINVLSLLLDCISKTTYFNNYQKHKSYVHMFVGINLCLFNKERMFSYLQLGREGKKNFLTNQHGLFAKVPEVKNRRGRSL